MKLHFLSIIKMYYFHAQSSIITNHPMIQNDINHRKSFDHRNDINSQVSHNDGDAVIDDSVTMATTHCL